MTASEARTQVGIVGAGPAGLLLSHLLHLAGIESVVLETRSREYVEQRIRAGVLEQGTVDILNEAGLGDRMQREGLLHHGVTLRFDGRSHHIDFVDLTGRAITVYGQHEVVKDIIAARLAAGGRILFETEATHLTDLGGPQPAVHFRDATGAGGTLNCDLIAGCDGYHGISRRSIPAGALRVYEREYPMAWLGILAESPPLSEELIYVRHERGFALFSMRSPTLSRLYLQCRPDENLEGWPDGRIWDELQRRLEGNDAGYALSEGPIAQRGVTAMRSFVVEPMCHRRLFLAGDAAHIVPPTGAKGMNLAVADVRLLAAAMVEHFAAGSDRGLERYTRACLQRVWKAQRFSSWMTNTLHLFEHHTPFERRVQLAELEYLTSSRAAAQSFAENYAGLPLTAPDGG
ncbi:MAG TPA: 4-hydroxybenzoate 3-monooxygenase [Chloroflexota bacterium]|nr:4-hydroxybenzoate 3-monooxygenase [Chloroflexota bacterium]